MNHETEKPLRALIVMATNPHNDESIRNQKPISNAWVIQHQERLQKTVEVCAVENPSYLIFVGGERFTYNGETTTEAEYIRSCFLEILKTKATENQPQILIANTYMETFKQIEETVGLLSKLGLTHGILGIISSWHQTPRIQLIFKMETNFTTKTYVANKPELKPRFISDMWNFVAGYGYTFLLLLMKKGGHWNSGGPIIDWFTKKRQIRK